MTNHLHGFYAGKQNPKGPRTQIVGFDLKGKLLRKSAILADSIPKPQTHAFSADCFFLEMERSAVIFMGDYAT